MDEGEADPPRPPRTAGHPIQAKAPPTMSPCSFKGSPLEVMASMAPMKNAIPAEPTAMAHVQKDFHTALWPLPRYSIATARKINASRHSVSGM